MGQRQHPYMRRAVSETGIVEPAADGTGVMPAKIPDRHRWVATSCYVLTDSDAAAHDAGAPVLLDLAKLVFTAVGCIDCEGAYIEVRGTPCPAGDEWRP